MKKQLLLLTAAFVFTGAGMQAQCTLTTSITANRSTNLCSGDTVILSGPARGDIWTQKATIGGAGGRDGGVGFSIGSKGYIGTGWNNGIAYSDFWEYDPTTDVWTQKASITGLRAYGFAMAIGSKGYIGGGYNSSSGGTYNDFWEFNPSLNTWTQKADYGGGSLQYAPAFSIGTKGYVGTGSQNSINTADFWQYDQATDIWTQKASFGGGARIFATAFAMGGKGYLGTGDVDATGSRSNDLWAYDPLIDTWTQKAGIPGDSAIRDVATSFSIGNKGYIATGNNTNYGFLNDLWEYDAPTDSWTQKLTVPGGLRIRATAFSIGNKGYFGAGMNASYSSLNDFYEYNPGLEYNWSNGSTAQSIKAATTSTYTLNVSSLATGTCIATASQTVGVTITPTVAISGITSICAGSGSTLTATGATTYTWSANAGNVTTASIALNPLATDTYSVTGANGNCMVNVTKQVKVNTSPVTTIVSSGATMVCGAGSTTLTASDPGGSWAQKNNFAGVTRTYAVGFSIGSKGYIGIGSPNGFPTSDFWEYDPAADSWTQKADFGGYFRVQAAGFSIGNKGYVGLGVQFSYMQDFWEFDPAMNIWTQKADYTGNTRTQTTSFSIGNKGYIAGGFDLNNQRTDEFYEYDPATDTWTQKAAYGGGVRTSAGVFVIAGKAYMGTGDVPNTGISNDMWAYDPASNTWTQKTNFPGTGRYSTLSFALGGKGYIGGGGNGSFLSDFYAYTPSTDSWVQIADFGGGASLGKVGFTIGSKAYTGTGVDAAGNRLNDFWEYDPSVTYSWSNSAVTPSISVTGSGNYSVTVSVANGCSANASQVFSITPNPTVTVSGGSIVCAGNNLNLAAGGANNYTWSSNAANATTASVTITPTANDTYTVTGAVGTCTSTAVKTVTVNALPVVTVNSGTVCSGNSFTISPNGAFTYTIAGGSNVVTPLVNTGYSVTGTNTNGCISLPAISQVTVNALPVVIASVTNPVICNGASTTLNATGATSYTWTNDITAGLAFYPTNTSTYTVTGIDAVTGCTNTAVKTVTVNTLPVVNAISNSSIMCVGNTAFLTGSGALNYTWSNGANSVTVAVSPTLTTTYSVTGIDANGCSNTATVLETVNLCTGVEALNQQAPIVSVYPNPSNGEFIIDTYGTTTAVIVDVLGKLIYTVTLEEGKHTINLSEQATGLYLLKTTVNGNSQNVRLIKQ